MEFKLEEQWAEVLTILFLALGFVIAVLLQSALFTFLSVIIAGFLGARVYYMKRFSEPIFPFVLIIVGFFKKRKTPTFLFQNKRNTVITKWNNVINKGSNVINKWNNVINMWNNVINM